MNLFNWVLIPSDGSLPIGISRGDKRSSKFWNRWTELRAPLSGSLHLYTLAKRYDGRENIPPDIGTDQIPRGNCPWYYDGRVLEKRLGRKPAASRARWLLSMEFCPEALRRPPRRQGASRPEEWVCGGITEAIPPQVSLRRMPGICFYHTRYPRNIPPRMTGLSSIGSQTRPAMTQRPSNFKFLLTSLDELIRKCSFIFIIRCFIEAHTYEKRLEIKIPFDLRRSAHLRK